MSDFLQMGTYGKVTLPRGETRLEGGRAAQATAGRWRGLGARLWELEPRLFDGQSECKGCWRCWPIKGVRCMIASPGDPQIAFGRVAFA